MKKHLLIFLLLLLIIQLAKAQNYSRTWVYSDTAFNFNFEKKEISATDIFGNTYLSWVVILPNYFYRVALEKINSAGKKEWQVIYDRKDKLDSLDYAEIPVAMTIDSAGHIYITCSAYSTKSYSAVLTIKYNYDGKFVWRNRFQEDRLVEPKNILFTPDKSILITANKIVIADTNYLILQEINSNGTTKFISRIKGDAESTFILNGNIIVAGATSQYTRKQKPVIWKFDKDGVLLSSVTFIDKNRKGIFYNAGNDLNGDIYAYGQSRLRTYSDDRILTVKYNSNFKQQWYIKQEDSTVASSNFVVNAVGNFWITEGYGDSWLTKKYNSAGKLLWSAVYSDHTDQYLPQHFMVTDNLGNIFINGTLYYIPSAFPTLTIGYDTNGMLICNDIYKNGKSYGGIVGLTTDPAGNIYTSIFTDSIFRVIKYKQTLHSFAETSAPAFLNNLKLYPNPAVNNLNIDFTTSSPSKKYNVIISDVSGNIVLIKQLSNADKQMHINVDVSNLKTGVYTISINNSINTVSKRFFKQ